WFSLARTDVFLPARQLTSAERAPDRRGDLDQLHAPLLTQQTSYCPVTNPMNDLRASHRVGQDGPASAAAPKTSSFPLASLCLQTFVGVVLACAITLSVADLFSIGFFFERNYNEGWNVY